MASDNIRMNRTLLMSGIGSVLFFAHSAAAVGVPCRNQTAHHCHTNNTACHAANNKSQHILTTSPDYFQSYFVQISEIYSKSISICYLFCEKSFLDGRAKI